MTRRRSRGVDWLLRVALVLLMVVSMAASLLVGGVINPGSLPAALLWLLLGWLVYFVVVVLLALAFTVGRRGRR